MLGSIATISLVIAPVALLVFFQLQFLPYHNAYVTWWHRLAVAIDIALLWALWPSIIRREYIPRWPYAKRSVVVTAILLSTLPLFLVFAIATFPGEWLEANLRSVPIVPTKSPSWSNELADDDMRLVLDENGQPAMPENRSGLVRWFVSMEWTSLHNLLVAGTVDLASRKPVSIWSNRLVLPNFDAVDRTKFDSEAKIEGARETISLRGRHLEGAVMRGAILRKVDFTAAKLQGADLSGADLRDARFGCAGELQHARRRPVKNECAELQGVSFWSADLRGADLADARLQGSTFLGTKLQGASLARAQAQGSLFVFARLQGANLRAANFDGADLAQGDFDASDMGFASLKGARLSGASLRGAYLEAADLVAADLDGTKFEHASLEKAFVWRANPQKAVFQTTVLAGIDSSNGESEDCPKLADPDRDCPWTVRSYEKLRSFLMESIPVADFEGRDRRRAALATIEGTLDPSKPIATESAVAAEWTDLSSDIIAPQEYSKALAAVWKTTGCAISGAPYVIRGLIGRLDLLDVQSARSVASSFLDEKSCEGAHGLSEEDKGKLRTTRDRDPQEEQEKAKALVNRGIAYSAAGDHKLALRTLSQAIALDARNVPAKIYRAKIYQTRSDYESAIADLNDAIRLDQGSAAAFYARGLAYHAKSSSSLALKDFLQAVRLDNNWPVSSEATATDGPAEFEHLIFDLDLALQLDPKNYVALIARGLAYDSVGRDYGRAIADYDRVLASEPDNFYAMVGRGRAHGESDKPDLAAIDLNNAIRLRPADVPALVERGKILMKMNREDLAIKDFTLVLSLDPKNLFVLLDRSSAFLSRDEFDSAIRDLDEAVTIDKGSDLALVSRGNAYSRMGNVNRALPDYEQALKINRTSAYAFVSRANALRMAGQDERAAADYDRGQQLDPKDYFVYVFRGDAYWARGKYPQAKADYAEAMKSGAHQPFVVLRAYLARLQSGDSDADSFLKSSATGLRSSRWPFPLIEVFSGSRSAGSVLTSAGKSDLCEARFFIGLWHSLKGDRDLGRTELKAVVDTCRTSSLEYVSAKAELDKPEMK
jgi:uncharacterized protein YjbI with pentapeptide repeats/tetratricopeptide (TPR) repeat protein